MVNSARKNGKITSEKKLNNSEACTCIVVMVAMATRATSTTNIAALATAIITVNLFIAIQMPESEYSMATKI